MERLFEESKKSVLKNEHYNAYDWLRVVCIFFVMMLHVIGHGGVLDNAFPFSVKFELALLLKSIALCAVDAMAMLSGFLLYEKQTDISRLIKLWLQVFFYSVSIPISCYYLVEGVEVKWNILTPILSNSYWFFTTYTGVIVFSPVIKYFVSVSTPQLDKYTFGAILITISVIPSIANKDIFDTPTGSIFLMGFCYYIGCLIKKKQLRLSSSICFLLYFGGGIGMWVVRNVSLYIRSVRTGSIDLSFYLIATTYLSPLCILSAIGLSSIFLRKQSFKMPGWAERVLTVIARCSFAAYLIQDNPYFREHVVKGNTHF